MNLFAQFGKDLINLGKSLMHKALILAKLKEGINRANIIADELEENGFEVNR